MLSVTFALSSLERILPPLPFMPPGARVGLANVAVMYTVFFIGAKDAFALNILKSALISLSRGPIAGALSLSGGVLSVCALAFLVKIFGNKVSVVMISVAGAMAHNLGQLIVFALIMGLPPALYYLPALMAVSIFFGIITGITLNLILPVIKRGGY
ncbi:MAG: Gx transporter family protein [Clostridiales bacterium]|jgi:heptaprenyl diphosphate synthase|nr:Gx transporter family protein [Clostridiales bacterium]